VPVGARVVAGAKWLDIAVSGNDSGGALLLLTSFGGAELLE
jgi:hypothetical protein